ncbi:MAG: DUF4332 domain-containing protein [Gemmatimonadota bacterium]
MRRPRFARAALGAGVLALAGATALAAAGRDPFTGWYYHFAWYPTLLAADAGLALREGRSAWLGRPAFALSLALWSVAAWLLFEAVNLRLANWYYVFADPSPPVRRIATALAFATVLPAIFLAHRWLASLGVARLKIRPIHWPARHPVSLTLLGVGFAGIALWRPDLFFPLVWGAVTLLLEPYNLRRDPSRSLVADLARGRPGRIVRLLVAGGLVGIAWESFNALARTRWIYTVPGLEDAKLFEMPLPGYFGFPVFALDCFVIYGALVNARLAVAGWTERAGEIAPSGVSGRRLAWVAPLVVLGALGVMRGMDRWTVDSYHPRLSALPGSTADEVRRLVRAGIPSVEALADADPRWVAERAGLPPDRARRWTDLARLATLRGIGLENARALDRRGLGSICALAGAEVDDARSAVRELRADPHAGRPARMRTWLRAAREACGRSAAPADRARGTTDHDETGMERIR